MLTYAVLDTNNIVVNVINAASLDIAQSVTFSKCVLIENGVQVNLGFLWKDNAFVDPSLIVEETPIVEPTPES